MSMFNNLKSDGLEEAQDRLGGYSALETDGYTGIIKAAYGGKAASGALSVTVHIDINGTEYRETLYVTNKAGENFYAAKDKDGKPTGKKNQLPGFIIVDDLCIIATGSPLCEQNTDEKIVNVYDSTLGREAPKAVPMLVDLVGQPIALAIQKTIQNKSVKGDNGTYIPTAETREVNNIEKVFDAETKGTVSEARKNLPLGAFWKAWIEKNKGQTADKRTFNESQHGSTARPGSRAPAGGPPVSSNSGGGAQKPRQSLFGSKPAA